MTDNPWQTISSEYVATNNWFKVRRDSVIMPNGKSGEYNVIETPPVVVIVALNKNNEICLIHEFRYPHQRWLWETPIGAIDPDDASPLEAAKRELQEETGFTSDDWEAIALSHGVKGASNQIVNSFIARDIVAGSSRINEDEPIDKQRFISFSDFFEEVRNGQITDLETIAAVSLAAAYLRLI